MWGEGKEKRLKNTAKMWGEGKEKIDKYNHPDWLLGLL